MKVTFLNASISRLSGGVFEVERRLAQRLHQRSGMAVNIYGLEDPCIKDDMDLWLPLKPKVHVVKGPSGFGYSPGLINSLRESNADLIHLHVLWLYPTIATIRSGIPFITTIHGMLDKWALNNSKLKKRIAAGLYERTALQRAKCLQAFTKQEYEDIRNFGIKTPVCIIPNGVEMPVHLDELKREEPVWKSKIPSGKKVMLFLGRIHPKKGLTNLISAWKNIQHISGNSNEWVLVIAGWDQGEYELELKQMVSRAGLDTSIYFIGSQFHHYKELCYAHANAFILPSFSEGLPMAVLEAWAFGKPVIMSKECNLTEGFEAGAAIETPTTTEGITKELLYFFNLPSEKLVDMGERGRMLVMHQFNWNNVADKMYDVYNWIINKTEIPNSVLLD